MDERKIYSRASEEAFQNSKAWLKTAKHSFDNESYGHAYALAITANEELAKSHISWLVSEGVIHPDDEIVFAVYTKHEVKTYIMLWTYVKDELLAEVEMGIIEPESILKNTVTIQEDEIIATFEDLGGVLAEAAGDIELMRREGVYVDVYEDDNEILVLTTPLDFPKDRAENVIAIVSRGVEIMEAFQKFMMSYPKAKHAYLTGLKQMIRSKMFF